MAKINLLDRSVFELIAAGEVIERPASVVKELVENAVDAGARHITVEIKNGGSTYMRVTDDGSGIAFEEIPTAFLRHATSKVKSAEDLDRIFTLGFRGEALASIAAVSRVEVLSKEAASPMGTSFKISGGEITEHEETGCPDGTTFIIRDLFYNVPARQKFLKKDVTEGNQIQALVDKLALAHPEISFRFIRDNKLIRDTSGNGDYYAAIYAVFGKQFAVSLLPVDFSLNGITVTGFISSPLFTRSNRSLQYFFVNGRYVRSVICMTALEEGYRNNIMTGKFPACVLNIGISPELLDVNVSPSKTEVRFAYEKNVFDAVHFAVRNAVLNGDNGREIKLSKPEIPEEKPDTRPTARIMLEKATAAIEKAADSSPAEAEPAEQKRLFGINTEPVYLRSEIKPLETVKQDAPFVQQRLSEEKPAEEKSLVIPKPKVVVECDEVEDRSFKYITKAATETVPERETEIAQRTSVPVITEEEEKTPIRVIGELFKTYIVCECGDEMVLIDKHAAHERINFERQRKELLASSQLLAESEFVTLTVGQYSALQENKELLDGIGLDVILSGGSTAEITASPSAFTGSIAPSEILLKAADLLEKGSTSVIEEIYDDLQHSRACKSAIKAHDNNSITELTLLAEEVWKDERIRFCPHGRPVMIKLTEREIEKYFSRIV